MDFKNIEEEVIYGKLLKLANSHNLNLSSNTSDIISSKIDHIPQEVYRNIGLMEENREVMAHRPLFSRRKYIGKTIIFCKKVVRKLLKWYINPITEQQTRFNNAVTPTIGRITEVINYTTDRIDKKFEEIDKRETENEKLKYELENTITELNEGIKDKIENLALQYANQYFGSINEIKAANEKYEAKINELQNRINELTTNSEGNTDSIRQINNVLNIDEHSKVSFFDKRTYSQSGEDSIIGYIFFVLGFETKDIRYLDLGANHAKELSNTYSLYKKGAKGVLVEANPELVKELSHYRYDDVVLNKAVSTQDDNEMEFYILNGDGLSTTDKSQAEYYCEVNENMQIKQNIKIKTITVKTIMEKFFNDTAPDLLSIDIEGCDLDILKSVDFEKYRPLIIIVETIEYRPYIDIDIKTTDVVEFMQSMDYYEYAFTGINSIFIDKKFMKKRNEGRV